MTKPLVRPFLAGEVPALARAVIAADRGGMAELVIHEQSGLLFDFDNAEDLRRQIASLLKHPERLEKLRGGFPPVKSIADEIESITGEYDTLLSKAAN